MCGLCSSWRMNYYSESLGPSWAAVHTCADESYMYNCETAALVCLNTFSCAMHMSWIIGICNGCLCLAFLSISWNDLSCNICSSNVCGYKPYLIVWFNHLGYGLWNWVVFRGLGKDVRLCDRREHRGGRRVLTTCCREWESEGVVHDRCCGHILLHVLFQYWVVLTHNAMHYKSCNITMNTALCKKIPLDNLLANSSMDLRTLHDSNLSRDSHFACIYIHVCKVLRGDGTIEAGENGKTEYEQLPASST